MGHDHDGRMIKEPIFSLLDLIPNVFHLREGFLEIFHRFFPPKQGKKKTTWPMFHSRKDLLIKPQRHLP